MPARARTTYLFDHSVLFARICAADVRNQVLLHFNESLPGTKASEKRAWLKLCKGQRGNIFTSLSIPKSSWLWVKSGIVLLFRMVILGGALLLISFTLPTSG